MCIRDSQLDHLGTPQELTDFGGEIVWSAKYNAYGKVTHLAFGGGEQLEQPLRFQGQYFDAESGLHYNRHRYYDPEVGRYLTPDPIKLAGGLNQYQYTPNPTGWIDPLGLNANCPPKRKQSIACANPGEPELPDISRRGAFRQAKADAGIPLTQQPDIVIDPKTKSPSQYSRVKMTDKSGNDVLDSSGKPIYTREYQYTRDDGSKILIQDHTAGHKYNDKNRAGDQGAHFNLRPIEKPRNGKIQGTKDHYSFKE